MDDERDIASRLRRLETPVTPSTAFIERLRYRLEGEFAMTGHNDKLPVRPIVTFPAPTILPDTIRQLPTHSGRTVLPALGAAVCVLAVAAFYLLVVSQVAPPIRQGSTNADYDLYTLAGSLHRIDPTTLADTEQQPDQSSLNAVSAPIATSADGSVIAVIERVGEGTDATFGVSVMETHSGTERASIPWKYPIESLDLSADGSRIVIGTMSGTWELGPGWHVYDTSSGDLKGYVATGSDSENNWVNVLGTRIDANATTIFRLTNRPNFYSADTPGQEYLRADDLLTGQPIGRVDLPPLRSGYDPYPAGMDMNILPGMALSPDGKQLAVVHADADQVTVVNVPDLVVEVTIDLARSKSRVDQALGWLGLHPATASAKSWGGVDFNATYAPDERHLYIWDASPPRTSPETGAIEPTDRHGLQVIDLETSTI
ncbi:MAG: hypothetical protein ACR2LS_04710, partial [Thermomicrobiales bacterium]